MNTDNPVPTIVVGVDGSDLSVAALRFAARLAPALNARIKAVSCWDFPNFYTGYVPQGIDAFEHSAAERLQEAVQKAFGAVLPEGLSTELVMGPTADALIRVSPNAAMLVLGRRGHGGFRGLLLGSVSAACVAHAHCPVLVVHDDSEIGGGTGTPGPEAQRPED